MTAFRSDGNKPIQPDEEQSVRCREPGPAGSLAPQHIQLMPQQGDLGFQPRLRPEGRSQYVDQQP